MRAIISTVLIGGIGTCAAIADDQSLAKNALDIAVAVYDCTPASCSDKTGIPEGFTLLKIPNLVNPNADPDSGFQAAAYLDGAGRIFIAFAGTNPYWTNIKDLLADESWATLEPTDQLWEQTSQAHDFATRVMQAVLHERADSGASKDDPTQFVIAGHSLGGALAQFTAAAITDMAIDAQTFTFNSPPLRPEIYAVVRGKPAARITNFLRVDDIISASGRWLGTDYLGQIWQCAGSGFGGHSSVNMQTAGLSGCNNSGKVRVSVWSWFQAGAATAWQVYQTGQQEAWRVYSAGTTLSNEAGSRLARERDATIARLAAERDATISKLAKERDAILARMASMRDQAIAKLHKGPRQLRQDRRRASRRDDRGSDQAS